MQITCKQCKYFRPDFEYEGTGICQNENTMNRIIMGHTDMFLLSDDFGCIFAEVAEQVHEPDGAEAAGKLV